VKAVQAGLLGEEVDGADSAADGELTMLSCGLAQSFSIVMWINSLLTHR
jgi:hypothetical protein